MASTDKKTLSHWQGPWTGFPLQENWDWGIRKEGAVERKKDRWRGVMTHERAGRGETRQRSRKKTGFSWRTDRALQRRKVVWWEENQNALRWELANTPAYSEHNQQMYREEAHKKEASEGTWHLKTAQSVRTQRAAVNKSGKVPTLSRVQRRICAGAGCKCEQPALVLRVSQPAIRPARPPAPPQICSHLCNTADDLYISHHSGSARLFFFFLFAQWFMFVFNFPLKLINRFSPLHDSNPSPR